MVYQYPPFNIALTHKKATAWAAKIKAMQKNRKKIIAKDLQTLIDMLNHVCFVILDAMHFMNNLYKRFPRSHGQPEPLP